MKTTSKDLDKFFTNDEIANQCLHKFINILQKDNVEVKDYLFFEPSAGGGAFLRALEKESLEYIATDIDPMLSNIFQLDFINDDIKMLECSDKLNTDVLVIGNPPFGKRSKLAVQFIEKSFEYTNYVGFILPAQFQKYLTQKQLSENIKLIHSEPISPNSFTIDNKPVSIRCVFQIYAKNTTLDDLRIRTAPPVKHKDFSMNTYNCTKGTLWMFDSDWDFAVLRQGWQEFVPITIKDKKTLSKKKQYMFFKANDSNTLKNLLKIDFNKLGELNTSVRGFGKADVVAEYEKQFN